MRKLTFIKYVGKQYYMFKFIYIKDFCHLSLSNFETNDIKEFVTTRCLYSGFLELLTANNKVISFHLSYLLAVNISGLSFEEKRTIGKFCRG